MEHNLQCEPVLRSGTSLSHFQIVDHIGGGGMGEVYSAIDRDLDRRVAIKVLPAEATRDASRITRFMQEAKAASALNHPNIVTVYEIGRAGDEHFIAMELVEGETLRGRFARESDPRSMLPLFVQIAEGLEKAHAAGIVHRDLKPENVMITPDRYAKILDFGLAKLVQTDLSNPEGVTTAEHLTREGTVVGTMGYMSPEQLRGERVDHRTDIFALGCMLYEAFARQQPFRGKTQADTIHNVLHETPPPLRDAALQRVVARALAKNAADRYATAREVVSDLRWLTAPPAPSRPSRALAFGLALGLGVMAILAAVVLMRRTTPAAPATFEKMKIVPLAGTSAAVRCAISPDGKYVAYTRTTPNGTALLIRQLATDAEATLVPPQPHLGRPQFSRDSGTVYYDDENGTIFRVPVVGGLPQKFLPHVGYGGVTFSPDGKQIAFARRGSIYTQNIDGSELRRVAGVTMKENYGNATWSPDANMIAAVLRDLQGAIGSRVQRIRVDVPDPVAATASSRDFFPGAYKLIDGIAWLPDGSGVVVNATSSYVAPHQLFILPSNNSTSRSITNDLFSYETISMTGDGLTLAAMQIDGRWTMVEVPLHASTATRQIAEGSGPWAFVSTDRAGDLVYDAPGENGVEAWMMTTDGAKRMIATSPNPMLPQLSPDGKTVAYIGEADRRVNVWRVDRDGSNRKQLTFGSFVWNPRWSADGRSIYCTSRDSGRAALWKVPAEGGKPMVIDTPYCVRPAPSPDGKTIAAVSNYQWRLAFVDAATGRTIQETNVDGIDSHLRWTSDGRRVAMVMNGNVVAIDMKSGATEKLTNFNSGDIASFDWSADQKSIICTRRSESRRVVLIRGFH